MKQYMTVVGVIILMVDLLGPAGAMAQTPETTRVASPVGAPTEWRVSDTRQIDVDGTPLSLSPDGQWLAGTDATRESICAWDVQTLTPTCAGDGLVIAPFPMMPAVVWAPDSSAVAFTDGAVQLTYPGDVMLFEVASGELTNLTNSADDGGASAHIGTAWTPDSQRVVFSTFSEIGWVDRDTGETGFIPLESDDVAIPWPVIIASDGSIVFRLGGADEVEGTDGIWRVGLDGSNLTQLVRDEDVAPGRSPVPLRVSPGGDHVSVASMDAARQLDWANAFYLVDVEQQEIGHLELSGSPYVPGPPVFSPDGVHALLAGGEDADTSLYVMDLETGESLPVAGVPDLSPMTGLMAPPTWAENDTVFIPTDEGGVLITMEQAD